MDHCTKNNIISPIQFAFRPNSSTTMALTNIINKIHTTKGKKHPTLAIYVDLSKAYDTVDHQKLLNKLKRQFNFDDNSINFLQSYFTNRQQTLYTDTTKSTSQTVRYQAWNQNSTR